MEKSFAKESNHNFEDGFYRIYERRYNEVYFENQKGFWVKRKFDENNNVIYSETSDGYLSKCKYDINNNLVYCENSPSPN